ncbi:MAG: tripartite tricarboxylate transporter substrate binding protein [Burkholderiales bacterium]
MGALAAAAAAPFVRRADAQDRGWPNRTVRLVVTAPPGSGVDVGARLLAESWRTTLGPVVVDNRPGADGIIATRFVAQAPADGYTLLLASNAQMSLTPLAHDPPPYNFERDFVAVAMLARWPVVLVVTPSLPVTTLAEFVAYARARPDALDYGSASANYAVATERLLQLTGLRLRRIPYGSVGATANALAAGDVQAAIVNVISAVPLVKAGRLRALAVNTEARQPLLPDVPTFAEAGVPRFDFTVWSGVFAPAGLPAAVVARLQDATTAAVLDPDVAARMTAAGMAPVVGGTREMRAAIAEERRALGALARELREGGAKGP